MCIRTQAALVILSEGVRQTIKSVDMTAVCKDKLRCPLKTLA